MTKQIDIILAEDGGTVTIDGRDYTLTLVEKEQEQPTDYSHLVGKWVKCTFSPVTVKYIVGKYYQCMGLDEIDGTPIFFNEDEINKETGWSSPKRYFDIDNPLDHNPDTRIPPPDGVEFFCLSLSSISYKMNDNQIMGYNPNTGCYFVASLFGVDKVDCHLEPCQYGELKDGEFFVWNKTVYLLTPQGRIKATKRGNVLNEGLFTNKNLPVHRVVRD